MESRETESSWEEGAGSGEPAWCGQVSQNIRQEKQLWEYFAQISVITVFLQIYTRSVIDPIPAPAGDSHVDGGAKSTDKQKKKTKMTDEEIMEKLSMLSSFYIICKLTALETVPQH